MANGDNSSSKSEKLRFFTFVFFILHVPVTGTVTCSNRTSILLFENGVRCLNTVSGRLDNDFKQLCAYVFMQEQSLQKTTLRETVFVQHIDRDE